MEDGTVLLEHKTQTYMQPGVQGSLTYSLELLAWHSPLTHSTAFEHKLHRFKTKDNGSVDLQPLAGLCISSASWHGSMRHSAQVMTLIIDQCPMFPESPRHTICTTQNQVNLTSRLEDL